MVAGMLVNRWQAYRGRCRRLGTMMPYRLLKRRRVPISLDFHGRRLSVPMDGVGTWIWAQWRPCWRTQLIDHILRQREGVFLDVGANYGQTLADFLAVHPLRRYLAFEPSPACVAFLDEILVRNGLSNCQTVCAGLSDMDSMVALHFLRGAFGDASATLHPEAWGRRQLSQRFIGCYRLDSIWPTVGREALALAKIDVEGAELEVLSGMRATVMQQRPPIICEVLHRNGDAAADAYRLRVGRLTALVHELDYAILRIVKKEAESEFLGLEDVAALPTKVWTADNAHECDYLFVPADETNTYRRLA
ncbi:MAG: FkbM family methyltransferase [Planctomycetes bacterium]|nr:FkbM family methyltransferase [Planctomycetota bacterium]